MAPIHELAVQLDVGEGHSDEELDRLTRAMRRQLATAETEDVRLAEGGEAPEGTRGVELAAVGGLIVRLVSRKALANVVSAVRDWVARDANREAVLVIGDDRLELKGLSADQQQQALDHWFGAVSQRLGLTDA